MAHAIEAGLKSGGAEVTLLEAEKATAETVGQFSKIAFGCPAMGDEVLEEETFEPFFKSVEGGLAGKKVALFGSYDWGDGQWMRDWYERAVKTGANVFGQGLIVQAQDAPNDAACVDFGKRFAAF